MFRMKKCKFYNFFKFLKLLYDLKVYQLLSQGQGGILITCSHDFMSNGVESQGWVKKEKKTERRKKERKETPVKL